jgi:hypothetical protein
VDSQGGVSGARPDAMKGTGIRRQRGMPAVEVNGAEFFTLNQTGGWALELQGVFLFSAMAVALIGPGRYRVNDR